MNSLHRAALLLTSLALASHHVGASKVLVFAMTGIRSHHMNLLKVATELHKRGHSVSTLVSSYDEVAQNVIATRGFPELNTVVFEGPPGLGTETWAARLSTDPLENVGQLYEIVNATAYYLHADKACLQKLQHTNYDVMLRDVTIWPSAVLEEILQIPSVELLPIALAAPLYDRDHSIPNPIAYVPQFGSGLHPNMGFWQRVQNYKKYLEMRFAMTYVHAQQLAFHQASGQSWTAFTKGISTSAAVITVLDWGFEVPQPVPPRIHLVGPILAEPAKELPSDLKSFLDRGLTGPGAVYVSMGTLARMNTAQLGSMAQALSALPNPVLWKLNEAHLPGNMTLLSLNLGSSIKVVPWAPQNDVLGHPGVKAFVTQSGINSIYEAAYHAKPTVAVPLITEQGESGQRAAWHGMGVVVWPKDIVKNNQCIKDAISQVTTDPKFAAAAAKVSRRIRNKPRTPVQLAGDIVEQVIWTEGDPYLETREHELSWWQLSLLDVKLFLTVCALLMLSLLAGILRLLWEVARPFVLDSVKQSKAKSS